MRAQSIAEPPSNDRRAVEPGLYMLLKCQKAAVRRKLRDRNPDLSSAFEIFDLRGFGSVLLAAPPLSDYEKHAKVTAATYALGTTGLKDAAQQHAAHPQK